MQKLFWPILKPFEQGESAYNYKPLNRRILLILGCLFLFLSLSVLVVAPKDRGLAYLLPVIVFGSVGFVSLIVGTLGSDRAVSRIWRNR